MSDITGIALNNIFAAERQQQAFNENVQLQILEATLTGLERAQTPKEIRAVYESVNRTWKQMNKGDKSRSEFIVNPIDIANLEKLAERTMAIKLDLAKMTNEAFVRLGGGASDADVMGFVNKRINTLSGDFNQLDGMGAAELEKVRGFMVDRHKAEQLRINTISATMAGSLGRIIEGVPAVSAMEHELNKDVHAKAVLDTHRLMGIGVNESQNKSTDIFNWKVTYGELKGESNREEALRIGHEEYNRRIQRREEAYRAETRKRAETVFEGAALTAEDKVNAVVRFFNDIVDEDGTMSTVGEAFFSNAKADVDAAEENGGSTAGEEQRLVELLYNKAFSGDIPGLEDASAEKVQEAFAERGSEILQGISGGGTNLAEVLYDENGRIRTNAVTLLSAVDWGKLNEGDGTTWEFLGGNADVILPEEYKDSDGKGFAEASLEALGPLGPGKTPVTESIDEFLSGVKSYILTGDPADARKVDAKLAEGTLTDEDIGSDPLTDNLRERTESILDAASEKLQGARTSRQKQEDLASTMEKRIAESIQPVPTPDAQETTPAAAPIPLVPKVAVPVHIPTKPDTPGPILLEPTISGGGG